MSKFSWSFKKIKEIFLKLIHSSQLANETFIEKKEGRIKTDD